MSDADATRVRRAPPAFRPATVVETAPVGPRLRRVVLAGDALVDFPAFGPGASVRLLVPSPGAVDLVIPTWTGNEFLLPDGSRPVLRTFTPLVADPVAGRLELAVVLHDGGIASQWAAAAIPGAPCAISGPGRGYTVDPDAAGFLLAGDESAIPAVDQLLGVLPPAVPVRVHLEVAAPEGRIPLAPHRRATVSWHDLTDPTDPGSAMVAAVLAETVSPEERIWVSGEAASVQRVRRHLFETIGFPRTRATVRGYWKRGHAGADAD